MKVISEISLRDFEFWSGGADRAEKCTEDDFDSIEEMFEELYPEGMADTEINDFFWFNFDTIAQHLGYEDEEDFDRKRDPDYIDDDEFLDYCDEWFHEFIDELKAKGDEKSYKLLGDIAYECFNYYSEVDDNILLYGEDNYDYLSGIHDNQIIFESLFECDCGHDVDCDLIPTLEDFRDEIMIKNKNNNDKQK